MTFGMRQKTMMSPRQVRGTVLAVLLCSVLAGCASVTASAPAGAGASSSAPASSVPASSAPASSAPASPPPASATGCASVGQATSVTVHRVIHLVEPTRAGALSKTQHDAALVQALFGQLCAAVSHASAAKGTVRCPAD